MLDVAGQILDLAQQASRAVGPAGKSGKIRRSACEAAAGYADSILAILDKSTLPTRPFKEVRRYAEGMASAARAVERGGSSASVRYDATSLVRHSEDAIQALTPGTERYEHFSDLAALEKLSDDDLKTERLRRDRAHEAAGGSLSRWTKNLTPEQRATHDAIERARTIGGERFNQQQETNRRQQQAEAPIIARIIEAARSGDTDELLEAASALRWTTTAPPTQDPPA